MSENAVVIRELAKNPPRHWEARLSVSIEYARRGKNSIREMVPEHRVACLPSELDARIEIYNLTWYSDPKDPYSFACDEKLLYHLTQIKAENVISDLVRGDFVSAQSDDREVRDKLLKRIAARKTYLEAAGHAVSVYCQGRILIGSERIRITRNNKSKSLFDAVKDMSPTLPAMPFKEAEKVLEERVCVL